MVATINETVIRVVFVSLMLLFGGCRSTTVQTDIINASNQKWRITIVSVSETKNGWCVKGRLNSPNIFGLPDGHILVSIVSENGVILDQLKANYRRVNSSPNRLRRHQFGVALFSAKIEYIPENATVEAKFQYNGEVDDINN